MQEGYHQTNSNKVSSSASASKGTCSFCTFPEGRSKDRGQHPIFLHTQPSTLILYNSIHPQVTQANGAISYLLTVANKR